MIKSYTDLEQSKQLAEILPLESADAFYAPDAGIIIVEPYITVLNGEKNIPAYKGAIPCWSLTALLDLMICPRLEEYVEGVWDLTAFTDESLKTPIEVQDCESAVDACYEMILKLHELKIL